MELSREIFPVATVNFTKEYTWPDGSKFTGQFQHNRSMFFGRWTPVERLWVETQRIRLGYV